MPYMKMNNAWLLVGGNMGNREHYLAQALIQIGKNCGAVVKKSALYQTAAWGLQDQHAFLNQAVELETKLPADALLATLLNIEENLGRRRYIKYGPRTIDIDILLFNDDIINTKNLTVPHPQLQNRRFVLVPLAEICGHKLHPVLFKTMTQLLAECPDQLAVQKFP